MELRWFTPLDGERVLQYRSAYGWEDVPEVSEAEESAQRRNDADLAVIYAEMQEKRARLAAMSYQERRALPDFEVVPPQPKERT
jgi:hypothetical protein